MTGIFRIYMFNFQGLWKKVKDKSNSTNNKEFTYLYYSTKTFKSIEDGIKIYLPSLDYPKFPVNNTYYIYSLPSKSFIFFLLSVSYLPSFLLILFSVSPLFLYPSPFSHLLVSLSFSVVSI